MATTESTLTQRMILCAGTQSGGTTLVSWCFLQRRDTDGVLDMANDGIRIAFDAAAAPIVWCKMTVGSFRWIDVAEFYTDLGWKPEPLLVVRDVRSVLSSLMRKPYGYNGASGDRPPLRMRLRRFLRDWELFRQNNWPIVQFEQLLADPPGVLRRACDDVGLAWDEAMLSWPKSPAEIAYPNPQPNDTFARSIGQGSLSQSIVGGKSRLDISHVPPADLDWLEHAFSEYNRFHGYPLRVTRADAVDMPLMLPLHERMLKAAREYERDAQNEPQAC